VRCKLGVLLVLVALDVAAGAAGEGAGTLRADRMKHPPYGLSGGQPSQPTRVTLIDGESGATRPMPSKFIVTARRGDALRLEVPGGGGWGIAFSRDPARVVADVIAEKITAGRAEQVYGVVVDTAKRRVEGEATERVRASRASIGQTRDAP
jgi:N-methylhydantoinase B